MRKQVLQCVEAEKLIVIVRGVKQKKLIPLTEAMYKGGIRMLELTYGVNGDDSDEENAENIRILAEHFKDRMYIGAGTVLTEKQVELTKSAGGTFIISPDTYEDVIRKTRALDMVSIPGAFTPGEIQNAHRAGADFVKIFPATALGVSYIKAVRAPLSHIKMLAVGGIDENNMADYLKVGVCGFGVGSNIVDKKLLANDDYQAITELAKVYAAVLKKE